MNRRAELEDRIRELELIERMNRLLAKKADLTIAEEIINVKDKMNLIDIEIYEHFKAVLPEIIEQSTWKK